MMLCATASAACRGQQLLMTTCPFGNMTKTTCPFGNMAKSFVACLCRQCALNIKIAASDQVKLVAGSHAAQQRAVLVYDSSCSHAGHLLSCCVCRVCLSHACRAMADTKFLKQWDEVVLKVHKLAIDPSSRSQRSFLDFESSLLPQALPPGTPRAWRKLVQDSKVRNCDDQWVKIQPMLLRQRHAVLETGRR